MKKGEGKGERDAHQSRGIEGIEQTGKNYQKICPFCAFLFDNLVFYFSS